MIFVPLWTVFAQDAGFLFPASVALFGFSFWFVDLAHFAFVLAGLLPNTLFGMFANYS